MKRLLLVAIASTFAIAAAAQDRAATKAGDLPPVQAPPGIGDPGDPGSAAVALPSPEAEAKSALNAGADTTRPIQGEPLPPEVQAAAEASELPVITVRQQGSDTVEEYRKKGKLYFVRVLGSSGPPKFYVDNPQAVPGNVMQQMSGPSGVVQPVYFKLIDWK